MPAARPTSSTATTSLAGGLVLVAAAAGLWWAIAPATAPEVLRAVAAVAFAVGIVVLATGVLGERGLFTASSVAAVGLLVFATVDLIVRAVLAGTGLLDANDRVLLGVGLLALQLVGIVGGAVAVVAAGRSGSLGRWALRALLAVVVVRAAFFVAGFVPFSGYGLLVLVSGLSVLVPLSVLEFGIALLLHGRGAELRSRGSRIVESWRSSTNVT